MKYAYFNNVLNSILYLHYKKNRSPNDWDTTVENLRATRCVSIVGSSQSASSTKSEEIVALKQQYQQLSMDYEQLCQIFISQMGGTCAPPFWPYGPGNDQPPPPLPAPPLF